MPHRRQAGLMHRVHFLPPDTNRVACGRYTVNTRTTTDHIDDVTCGACITAHATDDRRTHHARFTAREVRELYNHLQRTVNDVDFTTMTLNQIDALASGMDQITALHRTITGKAV